MTVRRSLPFNYLMNLTLKASGIVCMALSYPYAYRVLGGEAVGRVAFSTSAAGFFVMLASLGIPTYGIRACARVREDAGKLRETVSGLLRLQGLTTLTAELLLFAVTMAVPRLRGEWRLFLIQGCMLLFNGLNTEWLFSALERYDFLAIRSLGTRLLSLLLIFAFVRGPEDYLLYAVCTVLPTVLGNIWNIWAALRCAGGAIRPTDGSVRRHFRASLVFFAQAAAITAYTNLDAVLLGFFRGDASVGAYDAAVKIKLVLTFFVTSLGTVLFPRFSFYAAEKRERELTRGAQLSADFVFVTALPLAVFFFILAPDCLTVLYGATDRETLDSLRLLLPTLTLIGCSNLTGIQLLTPMGREKTVMRSVIFGAAADFAADLLLIPLWGAAGAALGTLLAEAVVLAVQLRGMRELTLRPFAWKTPARIGTISLLAGVPLAMMPGSVSTPLPRMALGAAFYFGTVYAALLLLREPVLLWGWKKWNTN